MSEKIFDSNYWMRRMERAKRPHHAVYICRDELWQEIEESHRVILENCVTPEMSILEVGCGWGRLLSLLPQEWKGDYLGIDLCPGFIDKARSTWPGREFRCADIREFDIQKQYDMCIMISIKPMILRNVGETAWSEIEQKCKKHARQILYLEYDPKADGVLDG